MHKLSAMCVATVDKACITTLCVVRKTNFSCCYLKSGAEGIPLKSFLSPFSMTTSKLLFEIETTLTSVCLLSKIHAFTVCLEQSCSCHLCCVRMTKWRANVISAEILLRGTLKDKMFSLLILSGSRDLGMYCEVTGKVLG